jgi:hypothetical protein
MSEQTYLTVPEAREYLRFGTDKAVYCWASTYRIPRLRRGKVILFRRRDLDLAVSGQLKTEVEPMALVHGRSVPLSTAAREVKKVHSR